MVIALPFESKIENAGNTLLVPGFCLCITSVILFIADRVQKGNKGPAEATYKNSLFIGLAQGIATLPGISRSGSTITAVLISCGGGELMCETLDHIDFERLKKADPKWFVGYSDNTNLTYLLTTICDTASVYGPCAAAFGMEPWHASIEDTFALLCGEKKSLQGYRGYEKESLKDEEHPLAPYNITEQKELHLYETDATHGSTAVDEVFMAGRLIGGCMDCLVNLLGTKFDKTTDFLEHYKEDGFIWFLEACDLNVMAIRRAMWQMEHAGWFRYVKGFLIGRPLVHGQEMMGLDQYHAVLDIIAHHNVPVIMDADLGHIAPMLPLISGSYANITATGNNLVVDMKLK